MSAATNGYLVLYCRGAVRHGISCKERYLSYSNLSPTLSSGVSSFRVIAKRVRLYLVRCFDGLLRFQSKWGSDPFAFLESPLIL